MKRSVSVVAALVAAFVFTFACTASAARYEYMWGGPPSEVVPGHSVPLEYSGASDGAGLALKVVAYAEPLSHVVAALRHDPETPDEMGLEPVATVILKLNQEGGSAGKLPILPIGHYVVVATAGRYRNSSRLNVTTLGLTSATLGHDRVVFAVDLLTLDRHVGMRDLDIYTGATGMPRRVAFDGDSLARYTMKSLDVRPADLVVASVPDGSSNVLSLNDAYSPRGDVGFIQTDRPVYRPGQTINLRAVVRTGKMGAYVIPHGTRRVVVTNNGTSIYDHQEPISAFGTVAASVVLPQAGDLGDYSIAVGSLTTNVQVLAYKKPEYSLSLTSSKAFVVGGDQAHFSLNAQYFFGRPVVGMKLHYRAVKRSRYTWFGGPFASYAGAALRWRPQPDVTIAEGDFTTDATGKNAVALGTKRTDGEEDVTMEASGRDASGRTVSVSSNITIVPSAVRITLNTDQWFARTGATSNIAVATQSYEDKPTPNVRVSVAIVGSRWDKKMQKDVVVSRESREVTTGADGHAALAWEPKQAGSYTFTATCTDQRGDVAHGELYLWATGDAAAFPPVENPVLASQKANYLPGERAHVLVSLPSPNRDVLLTVSSDRLVSSRIVRIAGTSAVLAIDPPPAAGTYRVTVGLPTERGMSQATADLVVRPAPKSLRVSIMPDKAHYEPGDRARFRIVARNVKGKPVRAEFALGVVDEALYAVVAGEPIDPMSTFYTGDADVDTEYTWYMPSRYMLKLDVPRTAMNSSLPGPSGPSASIRSNFQDTAYWAPSVVTDANGQATVSFTWPDNLTTWRATGIGVTKDTSLGTATAKALVTKDFLVRLETTRFLRAGDKSEITGIAQGMADHPNVNMTLDTGAIGLGKLSAALHLDASGSANTSWPLTAPGVGDVTLTLSGSDGLRTDAMQSALPLLAGTAAEHVRSGGSLPINDTLPVVIPAGYVGGNVTITLAPSLIAQLVQNLRLLDVYPYYCTEQTMSAALPAISIDKVLKQTGLDEPDDVDPSKIVKNAIARLQELQHDDGSFGWWEHDTAHPYMTAYALSGLAAFRDGGYTVPDGVISRAVTSLVAQLATSNSDTLAFWGGAQRDSEWNTRAFMLYALADADQETAKGTASSWYVQTLAHAKQLNPYALAVLGLAEHRLGNDTTARQLLTMLDARATEDGPYVYWRGDTWHYAWEDDPIETTAYALRLEAALAPDSPRVQKVIAFLRAQRRGDWWYTTKDTAAAIYALTEAMHPSPEEMHPDENIRITLDGKELKSQQISSPVLDAGEAQIVIPASQIRNGGTIRFEQSGRGSLYWSADQVRYVPVGATQASDAPKPLLERLFAKAPDLTISRSYDVGHPGPWRVGDQVTVTVTVRSKEDTQYVMVEDPYPAGAEHQDEQGRAGADSWSGVQLLDDKAAFFADRLYAGRPLVITYTLRVTTPGTYTAPPPIANAMYGPPVSAVGTGQTVIVVP